MKKAMILLLIGGSLLSASLIGCGSRSGTVDTTTTTTTTSTTTTTTTTTTSSTTTTTNMPGTPPSIFSVGPADLSINVSPTSSVEVTFSEAMYGSAAESAFSLSTGGSPVSGVFSWSGYTMKFKPGSDLANSASYTLAVSTAAENGAGDHLASAYSSTFTTGAAAVAPPSITNRMDELATSDLSSWTEVAGGASRVGIKITSGGNTLHYTRNDLDIDNGKAFQIEAKFSAEGLGADGERGARMWVKFRDSGLPPGDVYNAELQMVREGGVNKLKLVDGNSNTVRASLTKDWTSTGDRLRVRIKRQKVSGTDYLILQAESSSSWDDPTQPNNLNDGNSQAVALAGNFSTAPDASQFGFGNFVAGNYFSEWDSVHVTAGGNADTILPYWPPAPPTPILMFNDQAAGNLQGMNLSAYCSSKGYLTNDSITAYLNANGATITGNKKTDPGDAYWDFNGLSASQAVTGSVMVKDVAGRSRTSSNGSASIPDR